MKHTHRSFARNRKRADFSDLKAVVVDDSEHALPIIVEMVNIMGFEVKAFSCPLQAADYIRGNEVDMLFTDYNMPRMNGLVLVDEVRKTHPDIPVVMITAGGDDPALKKTALKKKVADFFDKPFAIAEFITRTTRIGQLRQFSKLLKQKGLKDSMFGKHTLRVGHYSAIIARGLKLGQQDLDLLFNAAQLHDIGYCNVSDNILYKPAGLSHPEMETVKGHTRIGYDILQLRDNPYLEAASFIALSHHERYNGSGYPLRLSGPGIPLYGRVTALADVFDVLTSARPYKTAWSFQDAVSFIRDNAGILFDPKVSAAFLAGLGEVSDVNRRYADA